jgi:hypothetical protein
MNKKLKSAILLSTVVTLIYAMMPEMNLGFSVVFITFLLANILLFRMVYVILRFGKESDRKFSEYFYDDVDSRRAVETKPVSAESNE